MPCHFRFKPVQKFDACSGENYSGGGQPHPGAAEQTVIAQSQHHQQFLGHFCLLPVWIILKPKARDVFGLLHGADFVSISPTDASRALPDFVELDLGQSNTENIGPEDVKALQSLYREHCEVRRSLSWSCAQLIMAVCGSARTSCISPTPSTSLHILYIDSYTCLDLPVSVLTAI